MTPTLIARYKAAGWRFTVEDDGRDTMILHYAQSPRMDKRALIHSPLRERQKAGWHRGRTPWQDMTEKELLQWEAEARAKHLLDDPDFDDEKRWRKQLAAALLKDPTAKTVTLTLRLTLPRRRPSDTFAFPYPDPC